MKYPSWNEFLGKYPDNPQDAFEALGRLLFRTKFGIKDSLPYFYNHAGTETEPISYGTDVIGFQSKFFSGNTIDDSQAKIIKDSIATTHKHYPQLNKYIVYTNLAFGNPPAGKDKTNRQKNVEDFARVNSMTIEWMFGDNILDAVSKTPLAYTLFFDLQSNISHLPASVKKHNQLSFNNISSTILYNGRDIRIDRTKEVAGLKEQLENGQNVIVYGESGTGKSAIVKQYWEENKEKGVAYYYLRGNQFGSHSINELFSMDEDYSYVNFRDFFNGHQKKILIIDSSEKLTEIDNKTILQLLLEGLGEEGWQFIFTCKANTSDDLKKLLKDIGVITGEINVEPISESQLQEIGKDNYLKLPENTKLLHHIQIPFNLARYCEIDRNDLASLESFRERVWSRKIRGQQRGGQQQKREECLLQVVEEQQSRTAYYVNPSGLDHDTAYTLVQEDVLIQHPHKGYAVKHDIYVDWALDYIVERDFNDDNRISATLSIPPKSISYLNAFGRWLDNIIDSTRSNVKVIIDLFLSGKVNHGWEFNILASVARSEKYATTFFQSFEKQLVADDYMLFDHLVDVMAVGCLKVKTYFEYKGDRIPIYKPVGKGWDEAVSFVAAHQNDYYMNHLSSVLKLLAGYSNRGKEATAMQQASELSLYLFKEIAEKRKRKESFWMDDPKPWCRLACKYAYGVKKELDAIIQNVVDNKWGHNDNPYDELIDYIVKSSEHGNKTMLYLSCMRSVIKLLEYYWRENDKNKSEKYHRPYESEYSFGLNEKSGLSMAYFPPSPFQTPTKMLLDSEEMINPNGTEVLDFIIRFVDACVITYSERNHTEKLMIIPIKMINGCSKEIIFTQSLWNLYRGTPNISMPHVLESVHMALEVYLLELSDSKNKVPDWGKIKSLLWRILETSKSASLYSIVASLAVAYPEELFNILMFLCQDVRLLYADLQRYSRELTANSNSIAFHRHKLWWREREESNKRPHRQQQLETRLLQSQYIYDNTEGKEAKARLAKAYMVVDELKKQAEEREAEDYSYGFLEQRIDYRSYEKSEITLENGTTAIQLTPNLTAEQKAIHQKNQETIDRMGAMSLRLWVDKIFKGEEGNLKANRFVNNPKRALDVIREVEKQLDNHHNHEYLLPGDEYVPYMASAVLIMYYREALNDEEKKECRERVLSALNSLEAMASSTISELKICIAAIPSLIEMNSDDEAAISTIISRYVQEPYQYVNQRICDMTSEVIHHGELWKRFPNLMNKTLQILRDQVSNGDYETMDSMQADAVLCLLTYEPPMELRTLGYLCIMKLSARWEVGDHEIYDNTKHYLADEISKYILFSPREDVINLVSPYLPLLNVNSKGEELVTQTLLNAAQYERYENFWIIWDAIYETVIENSGRFYYHELINEYLLNPLFFQRDYDDWFKLEEKGLAFYEKVIVDIGGHPAVIFALSRVFGTIGKQLSKQSINLFYQIISNHTISLQETKNKVLHYLLIVVKKVMAENSEELKMNPFFKKQYSAVLEFMRKNGSSEAAEMLNLL